MNLPADYELLIADFNAQKQALYEIISRESPYNVEDFDFLWSDLVHFLESLPQVLNNLSMVRDTISASAGKICKGTSLEWLPWGDVLFCPASNAVIPVVPTTMLSLLLAGNNVVLAPSRKTIESAKCVVNLITNRFPQWKNNINLFDGGGRSAMDQYVKRQKVKLLWFQGDSNHRATIIKDCLDNNVDYVFEGSGNCLTIVDNMISEQKIKEVARTIFHAEQLCHGRLCTTPRIVFVGQSCVNEFKNHIQALVQSFIGRKFDLFEYSINCFPLELLEQERFDDVITLIAFETLSDVLKYLRNYRFGIQVAFFTEQEKKSVIHLFSEVMVSRFLFNTSPVFQRSAIAWGGYRFSGPNPVCGLIEKSQRTVVIHE